MLGGRFYRFRRRLFMAGKWSSTEVAYEIDQGSTLANVLSATFNTIAYVAASAAFHCGIFAGAAGQACLVPGAAF
jgi:hypothetical protein